MRLSDDCRTGRECRRSTDVWDWMSDCTYPKGSDRPLLSMGDIANKERYDRCLPKGKELMVAACKNAVQCGACYVAVAVMMGVFVVQSILPGTRRDAA